MQIDQSTKNTSSKKPDLSIRDSGGWIAVVLDERT
jgi:hypothetical protein